MIVQVKLNRPIGRSFSSAEEEESIPTSICAEWYGSMVIFKFFIEVEIENPRWMRNRGCANDTDSLTALLALLHLFLASPSPLALLKIVWTIAGRFSH